MEDDELLELDEPPPPVEDEEDWVDLDDVVGLVGESMPHAARSPTPARAIPPERIFRKTRRSSRSASWFGFDELSDIRLTSVWMHVDERSRCGIPGVQFTDRSRFGARKPAVARPV